MMNQPRYCPTCGVVLPDNRLPGLCPACTWRGLSESDEEAAVDAAPAARAAGVLMRVPGYEIVEEIARGGMGIVYRARQLEPPRTVALKMLLPHQLGSSDMAERFRLEIRTLTELEHPAILPVYHVGEHDRLPFFTMKLAAGGTLAARKMDFAGQWRAIAELVATLADAVHFAHERGVLHRDLKPGNVLFDNAGRPYVSDFGLAKLVGAESDLTRSADFLGTPHYVAPEVAAHSARSATTASDIYSLGAILYELLAGHPPFDAEGVPALLRKIAEEEAVAPSAVKHEKAKSQSLLTLAATMPRDLEVICLKCLAKEPARRYHSACELAEDLRRWVMGRTILARPATRLERLQSWTRRNPIVATLWVALALVIVAGAIMQGRAYHNVSDSLRQSKRSEAKATENLHATLVSQARAQRVSGRIGQRFDTLATIDRAAQIRRTPELRNEMAAALAKPDLRLDRSWPVWFNRGRTTIAFTPGLSAYIEGMTNGGFVLRSSHDQTEQRRFASGNSGELLRASFSPDSTLIAAEFYDGALELWSREGEGRLQLSGSSGNRALADFHPQGHTIALHVPGHGVFFHTLSNGMRQPLVLTNEPASFLCYEPAGDALAIVRKNTLEVWLCTNKTMLWSAPVSNAVAWAAWSPNRRWLLAASDWTQEMLAFESRNGQVFTRFPVQGFSPGLFEFNPDGLTFASEAWDRTLRFWDIMSGQEILRTDASVRALRFSRDGRRLVASPATATLGIFEVAPAKVFREFRRISVNKRPPESFFASSSDERFLLSMIGDRLVVWDTRAGEEAHSEIIRLGQRGGHAAQWFGAGGKEIVHSRGGAGTFRHSFRWRESETRGPAIVTLGSAERTEVPRQSVVRNVSAEGERWAVESNSGTIELWTGNDPSQARVIAQDIRPRNVQLSRDGRWMLATAYPGTALRVWEIAKSAEVKIFGGYSIGEAWFSPDSRWVVASTPTEYRLWETGTWKAGPVWSTELGGLTGGTIAFAQGGRLAALQDAHDTFRLVSFPEGRELIRLEPPALLGTVDVMMSEDGSRLWILGFGNRIYEWNLKALRQELAMVGLDW